VRSAGVSILGFIESLPLRDFQIHAAPSSSDGWSEVENPPPQSLWGNTNQGVLLSQISLYTLIATAKPNEKRYNFKIVTKRY
jgi:hypothetical protein